MFSSTDAFADELDQEGAEGSDSGTADEWLSFCDSGFPSVVRVEDLGCIGIVVRTTQGGVEVAVPSGAATSGMPDLVGVELASEPGTYSGASGAFATVNLVELTGDSSDRLKPLEELPVELVGFDDSGRLPLPAQLLEISQAQIKPSSVPGGTAASSGGKRASSKRTAVARASKQPAPKAPRRPSANAFQELIAQRLEEFSGRLSARDPRKRKHLIHERSSGPPTATSWIRCIRLGRWGSHCTECPESDRSLAQRCYRLRTGSSAAWRRIAPWRPQEPAAQSSYRSDPSCELRSPSLRTMLQTLVVLFCASQARWSRNRALQVQFRTLSG